MVDMKKLLHAFDEADELLNGKIEKTNLSTIVASATASVENKKTVLIRGTGRNIESLKVGGKTVQDGVPTPDAPVEVKGVGDKSRNLINVPDRNDYKVSSFYYVDIRTDFKPINGKVYTLSYEINNVNVTPFGASVNRATETTIISDVREVSNLTNGKVIITFTAAGYDDDKPYFSFRPARYSSPTTTNTFSITNVMLEEGSTATPYEPYGKYKIPVSCNGETTNIYLDAPLFDGEVADLVSGKAEKKWGILRIKDITGLINYKTNVFGFRTNASGISFKRGGKVCSNIYKYGGANSATAIQNGENNTIYNNSDDVILWKDTRYSDDQTSYMNGVKDDEYIIYELDIPTANTFNGTDIPTTAAEQEVNINTELVPSSIEVVTFGDYYTKSEVDKMTDNTEKVVEYENVIDVVSTTATKIPFVTMFPDVDKKNVISLVVMTGPYNNDNITRYLDTLMDLRITSTVNQKVAVRVRCVYK